MLVALASLGAAGAGATEPAVVRDSAAHRLAASTPRVIGLLQTMVRYRLDLAYPVALQRVRDLASCQELFSALGADGLEKLSRTIYLPPQPGESSTCRSLVSAFTGVGTPHTRLCPAFGRLRNDRAAIVLIHEALHYAGLGERPSDPDGLTALQINHLVEAACGL